MPAALIEADVVGINGMGALPATDVAARVIPDKDTGMPHALMGLV